MPNEVASDAAQETIQDRLAAFCSTAASDPPVPTAIAPYFLGTSVITYRPTVFTFVRFLLSLLLRSYFTLLLFAELLSNVQKQRNLHQLQNLPMKKAFRKWQKYYICPLRFYLFIYFCLSIHFWQCLELRHWVRHSFSLNQYCHCHLQILGEVSWPLQIIIMVPLVFNPSKAHL